MFSAQQLTGINLPDKTLCLTFDDGPGETAGEGPGPKTLRLASYLSEHGVFSTFFMVGRSMAEYPDIPQAVAALGHTIGNHTYQHLEPLPALMEEGQDIASEILMTDDLIRKYSSDRNVYFRAPWGLWTASVADHLNEHAKNGLDHIGPFNWDIDSDDWAYWRDGGAPGDCAAACLDKIRQINRGIILMHDSTADIPHIRENNQTFETVQILIPRLKDLGYRFVGLDKILQYSIEQAPPAPF